MRSSRVSLRPATTHVSVSGTPASTSAWRTCHPHAVATASASAPGQLGHPLAGLGQQVQHAELGQHDLVPVGPGADDAGQPPHPVGQRAGPGVDEAGRQRRPTWRSGRAPGRRGRCAGGRRASGRARRARDRSRSTRSSRARSRSAALVGRWRSSPSSGAGAGARARSRRGGGVDRRPAGVCPSTHELTPAGAGAGRHVAAHPHDQQGQGVLARVRSAGARAPPGDVGVVDHRVVRLAPGAPAAAPRRALVGPERRPAGGDGEPLGGGEARRRGGDGHHLLDRPARRLAHPVDCTEGVSQRPGRPSSLGRRRGRRRFRGHPSVTRRSVHLRRVGLNGRPCTRRPSSRRSPRSSWPSCRTRRCWRRSCCRPASSGRCRCGSAPPWR